MMLKTHLAVVVFAILLMIDSVENKLVFVLVALISTYLPDIDSRYSKIGQKSIARLLQWFTKHRGMIHSFTFLCSLTIIFVLIWPIGALGFFLGYGLHLFTDSFTRDGIMPFYPWKKRSEGFMSTNGKIEKGFFVVIVIIDIALIFFKVA
jgi:membrane-bound metal-dependent hydrolase YbcI (DUF457 family)